MQLTNTSGAYGAVTKTFHWLIALAILSMFPLGLIATGMAETLEQADPFPGEAYVNRTLLLFSLHKTLGVLIFVTALARILWALSQPRPGLLNADHRAEAFAAHLVHGLLYGALVIVPLSGWLHHASTVGYAPLWLPFGDDLPGVPKDPALSALFSGVHHIGVLVLGVALILHIAGAVKHHVIDRDATLRRMLPGGGAAPTPPAQAHARLPAIAALIIWAGVIAVGMAPALTPTVQNDSPSQQTGGNWQVQDGALALSITQMGQSVSGEFSDWSAEITFDADAPVGPVGEVSVRIDIASLTLGTVTDQAKGPDFLDAQTHPVAVFSAALFRMEQGFEARGTLDLRGVSAPLTLPFNLEIDGDTARMTGIATLDRRRFQIGGSVSDAATLGFDVVIDVDLVAQRAP